MFPRTALDLSTTQAIQVSRLDRWFIHQRLQELMIPSWCLEDGSLHVKIHNAMTALLVRSVVQQYLASRRDLVAWLERCWQTNV